MIINFMIKTVTKQIFSFQVTKKRVLDFENIPKLFFSF